jgi:hypothetical protein
MRKIFIHALALVILCSSFYACSKSGDAEKEKGVVEKATDKVAEEMVKKIQIPLDRARDAKEIQENRASAIDDIVKGQ